MKEDPRPLRLFRDDLHDKMTLMCHIVGATRLLAASRDARHAADTSHESLHSSISPYHDDEVVNHAFGSTSPLDHGQDIGDPFGNTPPHNFPDEHVPILVEVPHVSLSRLD